MKHVLFSSVSPPLPLKCIEEVHRCFKFVLKHYVIPLPVVALVSWHKGAQVLGGDLPADTEQEFQVPSPVVSFLSFS